MNHQLEKFVAFAHRYSTSFVGVKYIEVLLLQRRVHGKLMQLQVRLQFRPSIHPSAPLLMPDCLMRAGTCPFLRPSFVAAYRLRRRRTAVVGNYSTQMSPSKIED